MTTELETSQAIKIAGAAANGNETFFVDATPNGELSSADILNHGGVDKVLSLTTSPVIGIVGVTVKANRKYFIMEALTNNVKWGFSVSTQSFDLFKSQLIMLPVGQDTTIYFKVSTGTGEVAIGEVS
jgi:hypothetical protein